MTVLYITALSFMVVELVSYIAIYTYIHCHDSSMLGLSIISSDAYKKRQRTNIISFGGQFCCFLAELVFIATMTISINVIESYNVANFKEIYFVVKIGEFGLTSTIQVLASKELRCMLASLIFKQLM